MDSTETKIFIAAFIVCVILGAVITYFIVSLINHQRRYISLTQRNILAELSVLEKDRMRIAADLHDELCPVLSAVKFQIDSVDTVDPVDQEALDTSKSQVDFLSARLRDIARDLMPASLAKKDLAVALTEFFNPVRRSAGLDIIFRYNVTSVLPEDKRINLYRIIQEITHNVVKHARANTLLVQLTEKNNLVEVICEDNGIGFNYDQQSSHATGIGLGNIRARAEIIGRSFRVKSIKGAGTQYLFNIPLYPENESPN